MVAIGIDRYRHWPTLSNAVGDAVGAAALLRQLGFEEIVPPLLDEQATDDAIEALVTHELTSRLQPGDNLILFFAGHGGARTQQVGERAVRTGYLIPVDGTGESGGVKSWIELDPWLKRISRLPPRHILVILDACFSGIALSSAVKWGRDSGALLDLPYAVANAKQSRLVITSALDNERAMDSGPRPGHSLFTGCLIEGLTGGVRPVTGQDGRPVVAGSELGRYVRHRVVTYDGRPGWRQTPDMGSFDYDDRGEMLIPVLAGDAPAMARGSAEQLAARPQTTTQLAVTAVAERVVPAEREGSAAGNPPLAGDTISDGVAAGAASEVAKIDAAANPALAADTISEGAAREIAKIEAAAIDAIAADAAAIEAAALAAMRPPSLPLGAPSAPAVEPAAAGAERRHRPVMVTVTVTVTVAVTVAAIVALVWRNAGDSRSAGASRSPALTDTVHAGAAASQPDSGTAATPQPLVTDSPTSQPSAAIMVTPPSTTNPGAPPSPAGSPAATPTGGVSPDAPPGKPASAMTVRRSGGAAAPPAAVRPSVASPSASSQATPICPTWIKSPKGAEVSWNGKVATVPIELPLPCGVEVTLGFRQAHYLSAPRKVTAKPGGEPVNFRLQRGFLVRFTSTPPGATVIRQTSSGRRTTPRQEEQLGVTPVTAMLMALKASTVTFQLDGYKPVTQQVTPINDAAQVQVALVPITPGAP
ncbi:MAG TPA: caspase family protein [Kofleriaceae bacterium]|jgi:hypothetical protein|nr:caspase family protein [Kofleriaceae bacterium]